MVTYKESGVDLDLSGEVAGRIAPHVRRTWTPRVFEAYRRGFGGLFQLDYPKGILGREYKNPILVGCTDGVGTKLDVAFRMGVADTIGIDLVALCVNDLVVKGAEPLFFLDYIAVGKKECDQIELILKGIAAGCREAGCAILGGETSEMPGFYAAGRYELAGFAVGVVEKSRLILGQRVAEGDDVLGLASSGIHANGYSLVRKAFFGNRRPHLYERPEGLRRTLGEELLQPTRIYVKPILEILQTYRKKQVVRAMAHITGGGLPGSIPRVIPRNLDVVLETEDWPVPPIFRLISEAGKVSREEMFRVFNMGIGMAMVVSPHFTDSILKQLAELGCPAWRIGRVVRGKNRVLLR
jgi:phosphoribosylformylglycinamidine cyclo-ligase